MEIYIMRHGEPDIPVRVDKKIKSKDFPECLEIRAGHCAEKLIGPAEGHGKVFLVGHGFINAYIARELVSLGWNGPKVPDENHWGYDVYKKLAP